MEAKMRLKEWLIAQVDSGQFAGLSWVSEDKSTFRIPWKHAAKQDYRQQDAALFKAWAVYKGKYREGKDKADPTMWKTRLRCALNKSTDFVEIPDRSQLDISEPYKVYRIVADREPGDAAESPQAEKRAPIQTRRSFSPPRSPNVQGKKASHKCTEGVKTSEVLKREHPYCWLEGERAPRGSATFTALLSSTLSISDPRMHMMLFYQGQLVMEVKTTSPDGCFILQGSTSLGNEKIYGPCTAQQLSFPPPASLALQPEISEAMVRLLMHLERGVLVWVAPDGVFIKRFCQGRVYWRGPLAQHTDRPNKLERERTCKLLDMPIFMKELHNYLQGTGPAPSYEIELCFGEEYPDPSLSKNKKLIMVQVVPLFAVELLQRVHRGEAEEKTALSAPSAQRGQKTTSQTTGHQP